MKKTDIKRIAAICIITAILFSFIIFLFKKVFNNNEPHYDYLIVGSELYGATFNYDAKIAGKKTLIIEKRNVTGGICIAKK